MGLFTIAQQFTYLPLRGSEKSRKSNAQDGDRDDSNYESGHLSASAKYHSYLPSWVLLLWLNLGFFLLSATMFTLSLRPPSSLYVGQEPGQQRNHNLKIISMPCKFPRYPMNHNNLLLNPWREKSSNSQRARHTYLSKTYGCNTPQQ